MRHPFIKYLLLAALALPIPVQAANPPSQADSWSFNPMLLVLVSLAVILIFVNALLANVLKQLVMALLDKTREERSNGTISKTVYLLITILLPAISVLAQETQIRAEVDSPFVSGIPKDEYYFLVGIIGFLMLTMIVLIVLVRMLARELRGIPAKAHVPGRIFRKNFLDLFNKSVAIDKEGTILLDHDYDGIKELDNDLPPWWKYGFVLTVIVACIYLGYYHVAGGPLQKEEYNIAVAAAEEEKAAYLAKAGDKIDETNVTMVLDASQLGDAKVLFQNTCAACHRGDGGGNVGPNLTDDYWLHGGTLKEVFKSIKYGWKEKGMPEWQHNMSAKQIAGLASYVKSLKGTHPVGPKAPQGDLLVEGGDKAIDSIGTATDPSLKPSGKKENKDNPLLPLQEPVKK